MKKIIAIIMFTLLVALCHGQVTTDNYSYTGSPTSFVVPPCVYSLDITAAGAEGGTNGGANGGNGATIITTIPVNPGDVIGIDVGGQGGCPGAGYNGGGIGYASTNGVFAHNSCGGGGSTDILVNGNPIIIAAGGGGAGGGSDNFNGGGNGGCTNGSPGTNTYGAGGSGGTQTTGGNGGAPWAGTPPGGQNGSMGQGGNGGLWQTASGGGGGGGYFGGGGGGNDGCCTGANGGGGGGGGSSLVPAGAGCTGGNNLGNGYVTITYTLIPLDTIINVEVCEGDDYVFPDGDIQTIFSNLTEIDTILSVNGCDSIITTNITLAPEYNIIENIEICEGDDYVFPDLVFITNITAPLTHISFLTTVNGCDSIITTQVSVNPIYNLTENIIICEGDNYTFPDGTTQNNIILATSHLNVFQTIEGCDSLIVTHIDIIPLSPYVIDTTICLGDDYIFPDGSIQTNIQNNITQTSILTSVTGCDSTVTTNISIYNNPILDLTLSDDGGCTPFVVNISSNTPALSYDWSINGGIFSGNPLNMTSFAVGDYDIILEIMSMDGCIIEQTFDNAYSVYPIPVSLFTPTPNQADLLDNQIYFDNNSIGGDTYVWDFGDGEYSNSYSLYHNYSDTGTFVVSLITQNQWGCVDTTYGSIIIKDIINIYIPNTFTPDSDEFNQLFTPRITNVIDYHLTIFNRWGEIIFESYNSEIGWDGTYSNQGLVQDGVYIWQIDITNIYYEKQTLRGHVTVLK